MLLKVMFNGTPRLLPRNKGKTLFSPFLVSFPRLLSLDILRNLTFDKDFKENNLPRFPFSPATVNLWFRHPVQPGGHTLRRIINMLNLRKRPEPNEYPKLNEAVFPPREEDAEGFKMLYHGTIAYEHAVSILEGIDLSNSEGDGDFSHLTGFYVTKNFEKAQEYAGLGNRAIKAAVLAFKIPNDVFELFRKSSLELMGEANKAKWEHTVKNIKDESKKYSFIEGPEMEREPDTGEKTYKQLPSTHQMCILKEEMAKAFDVHLHAVVFYNIGVEATEGQP